MNTQQLLLVPALLFVAIGCTPDAVLEPQSEPAPKQEPVTNGIDIPATVRRNLGLTFATVEARHVAQTIRMPGAFELEPRARREYRMALPGKVELMVDQLEVVTKGQPLFRFQSTGWPELVHEILAGEQAIDTAVAETAVAKAKIEEARNSLGLVRERIAALAEADFKHANLEAEASTLAASLPRLEAELHLIETGFANAGRMREHALHRASQATGISEERLEAEVIVEGRSKPTYLTITWIEVRAEEDGVVGMLAVTDGAFVESPTLVVSTVDPKQVRFRALALQGDLSRLLDAPGAFIVPPRSPGLPLSGRVPATVQFGLEAHAKERTMVLFATPTEGASWARPGAAAFLEVVVESSDGAALAIPRSAVVQDDLVHVFFRRDPSDPNRAIRVEADMGVSDGRWVALNSGVMAGDEVVLEGAYELKLATQRSGASSQGGHFHADGTHHEDDH